MMLTSLLLVLAAQPSAGAAAPTPDIQLRVDARADRVVVERRGRADLQARAAVNGRPAETAVDVAAPELPEGRRELRNVEVRVRAETRIAAPLADILEPGEQQEPPPRP